MCKLEMHRMVKITDAALFLLSLLISASLYVRLHKFHSFAA